MKNENNTSAKMTNTQIAKLSLLKMSVNVPAAFRGYLEFLTKLDQPQYVASEWLARLETVAPGVTAKYWSIVNN